VHATLDNIYCRSEALHKYIIGGNKMTKEHEGNVEVEIKIDEFASVKISIPDVMNAQEAHTIGQRILTFAKQGLRDESMGRPGRPPGIHTPKNPIIGGEEVSSEDMMPVGDDGRLRSPSKVVKLTDAERIKISKEYINAAKLTTKKKITKKRRKLSAKYGYHTTQEYDTFSKNIYAWIKRYNLTLIPMPKA